MMIVARKKRSATRGPSPAGRMINSDMLVLVSYVEQSTNSICCQELLKLDDFEHWDGFSDLELGYEIEIPSQEFANSLDCFAMPNLELGLSVSSVRLRVVPVNYRMRPMPSGGELFYMIYKGKGLSAFSMREDDDESVMLDEQIFQTFVESSHIKKRVIQVKIAGSDVKYLLFYLPDQRWRADIYENLKKHLAASTWTVHLENIEGIALDYISSSG